MPLKICSLFLRLHARGNKSSAANLGLFCTISCDNLWLWFFILHARGNKSSAANLGLFLHDFVRQLLTLIFILHVRGNKSSAVTLGLFCTISCDNFWLDLIYVTFSQFLMIWVPCSAPRLNSKILNFLNNHFGQPYYCQSHEKVHDNYYYYFRWKTKRLCYNC